MEDVINFFNSRIGRFVIIAFVIIVISYVAILQYQKSKYNGMTKRGVINSVSEMYVAERRASAQSKADWKGDNTYELEEAISLTKNPDIVSKIVDSGWDSTKSLYAYYDIEFPPDIDNMGGVKQYLRKLRLDYNKHGELLAINKAVNDISYLSDDSTLKMLGIIKK